MSFVHHDFLCNGCKHEFDVFYRRNEKQKCPECGEENLTIVIKQAQAFFGVESSKIRLDREKPKHYSDLLEASKLKNAALEYPESSSERKGIEKEIQNLQKL